MLTKTYLCILKACPPCRTCKSCHLPKVDYFVGNLALCAECFQLRQHGNYCPLCQQCYDSDDYDSKVMGYNRDYCLHYEFYYFNN